MGFKPDQELKKFLAEDLGKAASMGKIGITCRQPFLGADEWIEEETKKSDGSVDDSSDEKETPEKIKVKK